MKGWIYEVAAENDTQSLEKAARSAFEREAMEWKISSKRTLFIDQWTEGSTKKTKGWNAIQIGTRYEKLGAITSKQGSTARTDIASVKAGERRTGLTMVVWQTEGKGEKTRVIVTREGEGCTLEDVLRTVHYLGNKGKGGGYRIKVLIREKNYQELMKGGWQRIKKIILRTEPHRLDIDEEEAKGITGAALTQAVQAATNSNAEHCAMTFSTGRGAKRKYLSINVDELKFVMKGLDGLKGTQITYVDEKDRIRVLEMMRGTERVTIREEGLQNPDSLMWRHGHLVRAMMDTLKEWRMDDV